MDTRTKTAIGHLNKPCSWDTDITKRTSPGFRHSPATNEGRHQIQTNLKMHYNWVSEASASLDDERSDLSKSYARQCAKRQGWKPGLLRRHQKNAQDRRLAQLILTAKPGVDHQLPNHILEYKEFRRKNRKTGDGSFSKVELFEIQHHHAAHHHNMVHIKAATDTSMPAAAASFAQFMRNARFTRGGLDKTTLSPNANPSKGSSATNAALNKSRHAPWLTPPGNAGLPSRRPSHCWAERLELEGPIAGSAAKIRPLTAEDQMNLPISTAFSPLSHEDMQQRQSADQSRPSTVDTSAGEATCYNGDKAHFSLVHQLRREPQPNSCISEANFE